MTTLPPSEPFHTDGAAAFGSPGGPGNARDPPLLAGQVQPTITSMADKTAIAFLPWLIFSMTLFMFALAEDMAGLAWVFVIMCAALSLLFVGVGILQQRPVPLALGILCLAAIALSVPVGNLVQDSYMADYYRLAGGATYHNVDPSEPSAMKADASVLVFQDGTYVDVDKSVGFMEAGDVYCVAPVLGSTASKSPTYWAVGQGCCDARGGFSCGISHAASSVNSALADANENDEAEYAKAVKMAASVYGFDQVVSPPLTVRWTANASNAADYLWWGAATMVVVSCLVHGAASVSVTVFLTRVFPKHIGGVVK